MTKFEKILLGFLFYLLTIGLLASYANPELFKNHFVVEDGLIEWISFTALLAGASVCFYRFLKVRGEKLFKAGLLVLGLLFFFGAGEEISWGQRIFKVESSEFFKKNNSQGETNIHNLVVSGKKINKIIFGTGLGIVIALYLLVLPVMYRKNKSFKKLLDRGAVPIAQGHHVLAYLLLFLIVSACPSTKKGELLEFGGTALFFIIVLFPHNKEIFSVDNAS